MAITKTILVGVSDIFFYTKIRDAFRPQGYTLERVRKQEDVVGLLSKMEPMALIINMNDDRLDATQILETVRSDSQAQHLPVLAFANHEEVQAWKEAKRLGINKIVSRNEFSARTLALLEEMIGALEWFCVMTQSILHSQHESLGAQFQSMEEWEIPAHYGDPVAEHLAVRQHVGIADLSHRGKILVTGDDCIAWLQSIISNDLLPLESGQGLYSSIMNHKGKMLSYFRVYRLEEALLVEDVGEIGNATFQTFRKFLLYGTKAKMNDSRETWGQLLVSGPKAGHLIQQALGFEIEHLPVLHFSKQNVNGHQAILARTEETGETDLTVFIPRDGLVPIWEKLWEVGKTLKLHPFGTVARKSLRIEAGHPHVGPDLNEDIVPPEANLEGKAFSLSKRVLSRARSGRAYGYVWNGQAATRGPRA